jgi:hypothetical protein
VISGFRRGVNEIFALLGCNAAYNGSQLPTFRDNLAVPSSAVKLDIKEGTNRLSRNVGNYKSTLRNIPEERRHQLSTLF